MRALVLSIEMLANMSEVMKTMRESAAIERVAASCGWLLTPC